MGKGGKEVKRDRGKEERREIKKNRVEHMKGESWIQQLKLMQITAYAC